MTKNLPLATLGYNRFKTPNLANYSPFELVFSRKPKLLLDLENNPDIKVSGTFKVHYTLLNKRLQYLDRLLQDFRLKRLAMINKYRNFFQYNSGDLVFIISLFTSQLRTSSRKVAIKYIGPLVVYKIIDPHNYLLKMLDGKILKRFIWTQEIKTSYNKNKSGKCT